MRYYLIKNSKDIFSVLQSGIKNGDMVCSIDEVSEMFQQASEEYVPCVFEIDSSNTTKFSNFVLANDVLPDDIKLIQPKEVGINNSASNIVYSLYNANDNYICDRINKISETLLKTGNEDLSEYLNLAVKLSFEEKYDIKVFAQEALKTNDSKINKSDLADSFEHASMLLDKELNVDDFEYKYYEDFPVADLHNYDDISPWAEWYEGELSELDEDELEAEVANFRPKALEWIKTGTCPPIIVIDDDMGTMIGDGRGRVSIAIGLNWDKIPTIIATSKNNKEANSYDRMMKLASAIDLGDPDLAGKSLADIVTFLLRRIPEDGRSKAMASMISKIRDISPAETAGMNMGDYSSMGQSLTFIKNVLAGHKEGYVRRVLDAIIRNL